MDSIKIDSIDYDYQGYRGVSIHPYPGTMPFPLAQDLVLKYSEKGQIILDPFTGSGTVLRAAASNERFSTGIDMNPLACLIAQFVTCPFDDNKDIKIYNQCREDIINSITEEELWPKDEWRPRINNWFLPDTQSRLAKIAHSIAKAKLRGKLKQFALLGFSRTVRQCSLARKGEFKLWKITGVPMFDDAVTIFNGEMISLLRDIVSIRNESPVPKHFRPKIIHGDSEKVLKRFDKADLVLTSPPYGDAWTTIAYGNFSMLNRIWLSAIDRQYDESDPTKEDGYSVGGNFRNRTKTNHSNITTYSPLLLNYFNEVSKVSESRACDLVMFCEDMYGILGNVKNCLNKNGKVILVVGPRTVSGVSIDMGLIFSEFMHKFGLSHYSRDNRKVSGKRLPSITSQGNLGLADTINEENIDIFEFE